MEVYRLGKVEAGDLAQEVGAQLVGAKVYVRGIGADEEGLVCRVLDLWPAPRIAFRVMCGQQTWMIAIDTVVELCDDIPVRAR